MDLFENGTGLFEHGILIEDSDVRIHVSPETKRLYVFRTREVQRLLAENPDRFRKRTATQNGVPFVTGEGFIVPVECIPNLRTVALVSSDLWLHFCREDSTSRKGEAAAKLVIWALRNAKIPLWIDDAQETTDVIRQRNGSDLELTLKRHRIQVKCDWLAGPRDLNGSGNLFLQYAERNPRRRH